jgi:hypothetical protein
MVKARQNRHGRETSPLGGFATARLGRLFAESIGLEDPRVRDPLERMLKVIAAVAEYRFHKEACSIAIKEEISLRGGLPAS